jgi:hypothetical protein
LVRNRKSRSDHIFRIDLLKILPSALIPALVSSARLLGLELAPAYGVVSSAFGPIISVLIAKYDRDSLNVLKYDEKSLDKRQPILEKILDSYRDNFNLPMKKKLDLLEVWDDATKEISKGQ